MRGRLLLTAPASGAGKTTVTCALLRALLDRGLRPASFKSGPDYIDPMFHAEALGIPAYNLDLFLMGAQACRTSLARHGGAADLCVIEGAMGYYDGIAMTSRSSAWALARATDTPAVLIVDGRGAARSLAALVKGFQTLEGESGIRGVIFNRVSPMLYPRLRDCVQAETGLTVYGFLPPLPGCTLESRHLGLVTAGEVDGLARTLEALGRAAAEHLEVDGLLALAQSAPALTVPPPPRPPRPAQRIRIGVARDRAFCFYYADALALLEALGAELAAFSPMEDPSLPAGISGLYLGGGYPEVYARQLARNGAMLGAIRDAVLGGMPTVAECGGFLYLHRALADADGRADWRMAEVLPGRAWNSGRLGPFGYIAMTARTDGLLCRAGETLNAHEFHYWQSDCPGEGFHACKPLSQRAWDCGWHTPTLYAGFPHFHFCGCPQAAERFVAACRHYEKRGEAL